MGLIDALRSEIVALSSLGESEDRHDFFQARVSACLEGLSQDWLKTGFVASG